ncbi:FAD/NAD(P)-binding protein [Rhizobium leguminosarum]|uniref:FAD/NAD(P)-binding protein n=1 Tax=Rhizobium leguminosarum TaxID=384 RepID=UPI003F9D8E5B
MQSAKGIPETSATDASSVLAGVAPRIADDDALTLLEKRVRLELAVIEAPLRDWIPERRDDDGRVINDVVIVGAGLSGLSLAFGLMRQGVTRVKVIDAAPTGREGPWLNTARMRTLRSPKTLTGPDLGVPSLTYRAWHEARYGVPSWEALDKIERGDWMAYLVWFRGVVGMEVENGVHLTGVEARDNHLALRVEEAGVERVIACRKVVLATGMDGAGGLNVPAAISGALPRERWTHSGEVVSLDFLSGRAVGVIGAAASSFDWAVAALEAGAASVTVLARSRSLPRTEVLDWSNFAGFLNHFADLDDLSRYRFARRMFAFRTPPTTEMFERAMRFPACRLVMGARVEALGMQDERITVATAAGDFAFDHLLLGTGYSVDLRRRPELRGIVDAVATWSDRFTPPEGEVDGDLLAYPYLGSAFEFQEKTPGQWPLLRDIHIFNSAAVPSLGPVCNGITGLKSGIPRLVAGLCRGLFLQDADQFYRSLDAYDKIHFEPPSAPGKSG